MESVVFAILGSLCAAAGGLLVRSDRQFRRRSTVVLGLRAGEHRDPFGSYRLRVRYRCPYTDQRRTVVGLLGRERASDDGTSGQVKVYVSPIPPHKARFGSALLGLGGGLIAFGVVWIVGTVAAVR